MEEASNSSNSIVEERKEYMVSLTGDTEPVLRTAHFIKTSENTTNDSNPPSFMPFSPQPKFRNPKKINLQNWVGQNKNWTDWVEKMEVLHSVTWKKVGIFEAIRCSTLNIHKHNEIFTPFVERWCPDTNTFVFPWGEASVTLEDMIVLGGFSVLGSSVYRGFETKPELRDVYKRLKHKRSELFRSSARNPRHSLWMKMFKDSGMDLQHEAFLAYWLSKYVFPSKCPMIIEHALSIAVHLASGTRIALAPAVLARIYRDLSMLKRAAVDQSERGNAVVTVLAPFVFVQAWIWERFVKFRPMPGSVSKGEPRLSRWSKLKGPCVGIKQLRLDLDSAGEYFQWRPYAFPVQNLVFPRFYCDKGEWISVGNDLDEDLMSFIRCLMPSEVLGIEDCIGKYSPHRVSMQFGLDQDIPAFISQCNTNSKIAWHNYHKPVTNMKLYIPPRAFEPDVTVKYLKWWKAFESCEPKGATALQVERPVENYGAGESGNGDATCPGYKRKHHHRSEGEYSDEDDKTIAELLRSTQSQKNGCGSSHNDICEEDAQVSRNVSPNIDDVDIRKRESSVELIERDVQNIVTAEHPMEDMNDIATGMREPSLENIERNVQSSFDTEQPKVSIEGEHQGRGSTVEEGGIANEIVAEREGRNTVANEKPMEEMNDTATMRREPSVGTTERNMHSSPDTEQPKAGLEEGHQSRGSVFDEGEIVNEIVGESSECLKLLMLGLDIKNRISDIERDVAMLKAARGL